MNECGIFHPYIYGCRTNAPDPELDVILPADHCQLERAVLPPADTNGVGLEIRYSDNGCWPRDQLIRPDLQARVIWDPIARIRCGLAGYPRTPYVRRSAMCPHIYPH